MSLPSPHQSTDPAGRPAAYRVLVVDDEEAMRDEIAAALRIAGFQTATASDAETALAALAAGPDIAVVVSDVRMPGRSGIALAEEIRELRSGQAAVEVLLLTAFSGIVEAGDAMRAGICDLLQKPTSTRAITAAVGRAMDRAASRRRVAWAAEQERLDRVALYRAAPVGLGWIDRNLRLVRANPMLADQFGLSEGADLTLLWADAPGVRSTLEPRLRSMLDMCGAQMDASSGQRLRLEMPVLGKTSAPRVLDLRLYPVPDAAMPSRVAAVGLACVDVTAEEALLRELDHRVKNAFAVCLSLIHGAGRSAAGKDLTSVIKDLAGRIKALARAHDLVRPAVRGAVDIAASHGVPLDTLLKEILAPYADELADEGRIAMRGPAVDVGPLAAPGLALVLHELATNAVKHGALSSQAGHVSIAWAFKQGLLTLNWKENGGPALAGPPEHQGFGARLMRQADLGSSGQKVTLNWSCTEGLQAHLTVPLQRLGL